MGQAPLVFSLKVDIVEFSTAGTTFQNIIRSTKKEIQTGSGKDG
jgi:hypothetical protein